jgi:Histidine kinase
MNPHFLFNSRTSIEAGLGKQLPNVRAMAQALADYLHYSLTHRNDDFVPMGEEYDALIGYLTLERARLDGKLNIDFQIDNEARKALVPGIILQPLVENAIKYGRETSPSPLQLRLHVLRSGPELETLSSSALAKIRFALSSSSSTNTCPISLSRPRQNTPIGRLGNPLSGSTRNPESRCNSGVCTARPAPSLLRT